MPKAEVVDDVVRTPHAEAVVVKAHVLLLLDARAKKNRKEDRMMMLAAVVGRLMSGRLVVGLYYFIIHF